MNDFTNQNNIRLALWFKWLNNSCKFDVITTLYLCIFYSYDEHSLNYLTDEGINILHNTVKFLMNNPLSENRFNIWSYINNK